VRNAQERSGTINLHLPRTFCKGLYYRRVVSQFAKKPQRGVLAKPRPTAWVYGLFPAPSPERAIYGSRCSAPPIEIKNAVGMVREATVRAPLQGLRMAFAAARSRAPSRQIRALEDLFARVCNLIQTRLRENAINLARNQEIKACECTDICSGTQNGNPGIMDIRLSSSRLEKTLKRNQ
jgi:hypothetical protein